MHIAIDIGGTNTRILAFKDLNYTSFLNKKTIPSESIMEYSKALEILSNEITALSDNNLDGIVISFTGIIYKDNTMFIDSQFFTDWNNKPLANDLKNKLNCNCKVLGEADGICAGLSEYENLIKSNKEMVTFIAIGTGIGGVKLIKHKEDVLIQPLEIGHMIIVKGGLDCACGQKGCVEAYASGYGLMKRYNTEAKNLTQEQWNIWVEEFGQALIGYLMTNPSDVVIFGGGLILKNQHLIPKIKEYVKNNSWYPIDDVEFTASEYGEDAQIVGALQLLDSNFNYYKLKSI